MREREERDWKRETKYLSGTHLPVASSKLPAFPVPTAHPGHPHPDNCKSLPPAYSPHSSYLELLNVNLVIMLSSFKHSNSSFLFLGQRPKFQTGSVWHSIEPLETTYWSLNSPPQTKSSKPLYYSLVALCAISMIMSFYVYRCDSDLCLSF